MTQVCKHGQLARSCEVCELEARYDASQESQRELLIHFAAANERLQRTERQHVTGRWCADHLCARCYTAPTARRIEELEAEIERLRDQHAAEMARLREAARRLEYHTSHLPYCVSLVSLSSNSAYRWGCDCGLDKARRLLLAL